MSRKINILVGSKFSMLLVIGITKNHRGSRAWRCLCDCGNECIVDAHSLVSGKSKSCGCYKLGMLRSSSKRHNMSGTRTHNIWRGIIKRCTNPRCPAYKSYGGRGINICERWKIFENFLADMGEVPSDLHSIERVNNDGNYEPNNCKWIPKSQQGLNTRRTRRITIDGRTQPLSEWCKEINVNYRLVLDRIAKLGWEPKRALREPIHEF